MGIRRALDALVLAVLVIGWLVRCTVRDARPPTAVVFYALPWPVLAVLAGWVAWRLRRLRGLGMALAVGALAVWFWSSWKFATPSTAPAELRVVQWNVARPLRWLPAVAAELRALDADVITVAESVPRVEATFPRWLEEFPGYRAEFSGGGLLCLVRGEVRNRESGSLGSGSFYTALDVEVKGRALSVLQVDLFATPWRSRTPPLEQMAKLIAARADRPLIVAGDFNTPRDSALFAPLRTRLVHSWEAAGRGCAETWPMPFPVLSLDHVWIGGGLRALRCEHAVSVRSDHRAVIVDLAWP